MTRATHILIVDDSSSMRFAVRATLENRGYQVQEASDGVEALKLAKQHRFDLVLTDINMPKMDGFRLIENLREMMPYRFIPIVTLTTHSDKTSRQRAKEAGATGWIVKPFTVDQLTDTMAKLTEAKIA